MRLAIFQYSIEAEPMDNVEKIRQQVTYLQDKGVDLLVLPEVCLTGFGGNRHVGGFAEDSEFIAPFYEWSHKVPILAGFRIAHNEKAFNRALFLHQGVIQARHDKQILFRHWQEHKRFHAGNCVTRFEHRGWIVSPFICYELRFPEIFRSLIGTELFVVMANWPQSRREHWLTLLKARAIENQSYVVGVNRLGRVGTECFVGDSVIYGPRGETALQLGDQETCQWADLDLSSLRDYRDQFPILQDAWQGPVLN